MKKNQFKKILTFGLFFSLMFASLGVYAQGIEVTGNVQDNTGVPLLGATILEQGTTNGTQTDFDGNFSITVIDANAQLEISYIGFTTKTILADGQNTMTIVLEDDAQGLDEVIVVGYGTAKKKNITGAVERVNLEDSPIALTSNTSVLQSIRGSTPGINIGTQNQVGQTPSILVRGQNSISGSNDPLIVLDGLIFLGSVADINPSDIASIDILKDASSAVVYGSRAANGVIIINTKKGKSNKPVIKLSTSTGFNRWQNKPDLLKRDDYLEKYAVQIGAPSVDEIVWEEAYRDILQDEGVDTDWVDLISRDGLIQKHNVSVSGNSEKINYFFSGSYEDQEGVIIGDEFERISIRSRLRANVTDWLEVGIDGSYTNSDFSGQVASVGQAMILAPIGYPYRFEGQPFDALSNPSRDLERYPTANNVQNALWGTDGTRDNFDTRNYFRLATDIKVKVPWIEGLSYTFNYTLSAQFRRQDIFEYESFHIQLPGTDDFFERYSETSLQQNLSQANGENIRRKNSNYVYNNILNYSREFGKHDLNLTAVATRDYSFQDVSSVIGRDFAALGNTTLGANALSFATIIETDYDIVERTNVGYLGSLIYAYDDKYHLNAAIRRDGASVFGEDRKFGTFWSLGGAWTLTEEDFIPKGDFLNYLKLNVSYGVNGNQGVSPYQTLSGVTNGLPGNIRYAFGDNPSNSEFGIAQSTLGNSELGWEETTSLNIGLHGAFLKNRISLDINWYSSETEDQIFNRQIPTTSGFGSILASLGQVDNKGLEISLNTRNIVTKDFSWSSDVTFWRNRNEVASLFGDDNDGDGIEDDDLSNGLFIGESLGTIFGYEYTGVVQESDTQYLTDNPGVVPGDPMFADVDGEAGITADDRKILGVSDANFNMGFANTITYKNFTFYTLFTGTFGGNDFFLGSNPRSNSFQNRFDFNDVVNGDFWTPENQSTTNLRPDFNDDRYIGLQSRRFIRLQNINLSYKFGQDALQRMNIGINSLELYASADNPAIFTDWFGGGDPERGIAAQSGTLPIMSSYLIGLNFSF